MSGKKRFFSNHAKSSAAIISLAIHAVLLVLAVSFVAVTVIKKEDRKFESRHVNRPKMQLKKLQVPVKIKKQKKKPKLRQRIVVKPMVNRNMPEIKMPEISGIKGGLGDSGSVGLGGAGSIGFSLPEIEIFGIKSRGEKIYLILDSSAEMMYDEMGGIPAYTIIKNELVRIVEGLGSTTIFNVCVFGGGGTYYLFPSMAPATEENTAKVKAWLDPLNAVRSDMGDKDYGTKTLGAGGVENDDDLRVGNFRELKWKIGWYQPAMLSMHQKADTIFLLTNRWPGMDYTPPDAESVDKKAWEKTPAGKIWEETYRKGLKMLDEENKERAARGENPKIIKRQAGTIIKEYFPNLTLERPPAQKSVEYTPDDFQKAFLELRASSNSGAVPSKSGISPYSQKMIKDKFSFNVIQFVKQGEQVDGKTEQKYKDLTQKCGGKYKTIAGLEAIQSYVKAPE